MDKIVYLVVTEPGGVDGIDFHDKGGKIVFASFYKTDAEDRRGVDTRYRIEKQIVDVDEQRKAARAKLDPIDVLVLGLDD